MRPGIPLIYVCKHDNVVLVCSVLFSFIHVSATVMAAVNPLFADFFNETFADSESEDEFLGFDDGEDSLGDGSPDFDPHFNLEWSHNITQPQPVPFTGTPGIQLQLPEKPTPGEVFSMFIGPQDYQFVASEMNRYTAQEREKKANHLAAHPHARLNKWQNTTASEVLRFFACIFAMGLVQHNNIQNYWSTDPVLSTSLIPTVFTKNRLVLQNDLNICLAK